MEGLWRAIRSLEGVVEGAMEDQVVETIYRRCDRHNISLL